MIIFTTRSLGYICGYLLGGAAFDNLENAMPKRFVLITVQLMCALTAFAIPFCNTLESLSITFFCAGICLSAMDTGCNTYMLQMWGNESSPFLLSLHFVFGIGSFVSPILVKIFFHEQNEPADNVTLFISPKDIGTPNFPAVLYAYLVLSGLFVLVAALWCISLCCACEEFHLGSMKSEGILKIPTMQFTLFAVITTCFLIFLTGSIDFGYHQLLPTFAYEVHAFGRSATINLTLLFWGAYTTGGFLAILFSKLFHPFFMIILCLGMEAGAGCILLFLSEDDNDMLAIGNGLLGLGAAALCGWSILWLDRYIITTYKIISALFIIESLAEMIIPPVLYLALQKNTDSLSYFVIIVPCLYFFVLCVQCMWFFGHGEKYISVSHLPEQKRRKRYFPIFLKNSQRVSEELILKSLERKATKLDTSKPLLVTKQDSHAQTQSTYIGNLLPIKSDRYKENTKNAKPMKDDKNTVKRETKREDETSKEGRSDETNAEASIQHLSDELSSSEAAPPKSQSKSEEPDESLPEKPSQKFWNLFGKKASQNE